LISAIPVIDLSAFLAGDEAGTAGAVEEVGAAAESVGFFIIVGHGVPETLVDTLASLSRAFFNLPADSKRRTAAAGPHLGGLTYFPLSEEALSLGIGLETAGDLKETLDFGPAWCGDLWPGQPVGLREAWHDYYRTMSDLAGSLRRLFALAIGLPEMFFEEMFVDHLSTVRVLNYPDQREEPCPGQLRAGVHTDYGFLTILRAGDSPGGLQVQDLSRQWVDVPNIFGSFVINIADALQRWTNGRFRSTPHRVVNPPRDASGSTRRQSIAFFHNPARTAVIVCLEPFRAGAKSLPEPITYGDYADLKYRTTHRVKGS